MNGNFIKTCEAEKYFGVSSKTLERWRKKNKIQAINPSGGCWYYNVNSIESNRPQDKRCFLYARVSTKGQSSQLNNQLKYLRTVYQDPKFEIVTDICSSLKLKRKGLDSILECADQKNIGLVVVTYKDRLCRYGYELLERIITKGGGQIVVLNHQEMSPQSELVSDVLAILTTFSARIHGLRKYKVQIQNDKAISNSSSTGDNTELDGDVQVDIQPNN